MERVRTVTETKETFLQQQVRLLTAILKPSEDWRQYGPEPEHGGLSEKAVNDALQRLNSTLKQHNQLVYSSRALRHVAEQIDSLYWLNVTGEEGVQSAPASVLHKEMDFTDPNIIAKLPEEWDDEDAKEADLLRYRKLQTRLANLDARRTEQQHRLVKYRYLRSLMEPLRDPQVNIQPNLVTRDGELGKELDRMRILLARVAGRIGETGSTANGYGVEEGSVSAGEKLANVLDIT